MVGGKRFQVNKTAAVRQERILSSSGLVADSPGEGARGSPCAGTSNFGHLFGNPQTLESLDIPSIICILHLRRFGSPERGCRAPSE
jgi:hypothetical protein